MTILNHTIMDHNKDLGNKKINNEQEVNEGFSAENLPEDYNPAASKLQQETETDDNGRQHTVNRARNADATAANDTQDDTPNAKSYDGDMQSQVENKDRNSDTAANRYPNSHPDNHINRGNLDT
ncbi:hypothetical protein [Flavobacterium pallidum]|uniref:Uncharacterized protein n=1 Tax=Flavobacterium pallidum TaxID=2172098 RepID=A0A2S1SHI1_9FLAO|nr:hypothetical protein [Flavobacterium pallidum]AWI25807.1 hypothetical protein HYN49_07770 [Flavobacterium pallidum]